MISLQSYLQPVLLATAVSSHREEISVFEIPCTANRDAEKAPFLGPIGSAAGPFSCCPLVRQVGEQRGDALLYSVTV